MMITYNTITKDNLLESQELLNTFFRRNAAVSARYGTMPGKDAFIGNLWGENLPEASDKGISQWHGALVVSTDARNEMVAAAAGIWYPTAKALFLQSVLRRKGPFYHGHGAAVLSRLVGEASHKGVRHVLAAIPESQAAGLQDTAGVLTSERLAAWLTNQGFEGFSFDYQSPSTDKNGRLQKGYRLVYLGSELPSLKETAMIIREEYRRYGINPLMAEEVVYSSSLNQAKVS